jgi:peptidoglycan-associated lipoprotein
MLIRNARTLMLIGVSALWLAGCSGTKKLEPVAETPPPPAPKVVREEPAPKPMNRVVNGKMVMGDEVLQGLFYFDFDQAVVKREGHTELNKHAKVLGEDRTLRVRLEGHADERGTREYNLALGERRANAVKAYLQSQGAMGSQMEVISYGEEKPAVEGHSESSWAQNRRVQVVYQ